MAEHSMCHPGRPGPQGEFQDGSPGFTAFHSAKSSWFFFTENPGKIPDTQARNVNDL